MSKYSDADVYEALAEGGKTLQDFKKDYLKTMPNGAKTFNRLQNFNQTINFSGETNSSRINNFLESKIVFALQYPYVLNNFKIFKNDDLET